MFGQFRPLVFLGLLTLVVSASMAQTADPAAVAGEVRQIRVDRAGAVRIDGFRLRAGLASIVLNDGILLPSTPVAGRPVEFVFLGNGRIELDAPDEVEAGQLELFTGSASFVESFERAVFVIALDAASDAVVRRPSATDAPVLEDAARLFDAWTDSPERKLLDIESRVFADAVGDRLAAGFFCGYFEGQRFDRFLYVVDPLAHEQVTLGRFVPPDLSRKDEKKIRRYIEKAQRKGKLIGLEMADLGTWDTWLSSSLRNSNGRPTPGARGVEPNHYDLDVALRGKALDLEATARIELRTVVDGMRAISLEMNSDLVPSSVVDGEGHELAWYRGGNELVVVLDEPVNVGDEFIVDIDYTGKPIEKVASGAWVQRATTGWYPHGGTIDRAAYTMTIEWPEDLDIVAPGESDDVGRGETGHKRQRWRLDRPSMGISFEVGRYDIVSGRVGDVSISVAVDRVGQKAEKELPGEILATVVDVMEFYTEVFGPYPLDRLQVVSSPREFSQGLLGFVSLATAAVLDWEVWGEMLGAEDRRSVIAHEVAHQWWGNLVGWESYRDQWISEAMATYSALIWARDRLDQNDSLRRWRGPTADWPKELMRRTEDGRRIESLGPLVMGPRLNSSLSRRAFSAIVYKKGAVVLNMLSQFFQEEGFLGILREIIRVFSDRVISTDDFLGMITRLGRTDLSWFARRYIFGTGLPEVYYSYEIEELDNARWAVVGTARQEAPHEFRYRVVEVSPGIFDLRHKVVVPFDVAESTLVVHFRIGLADEYSDADGRRRYLTGRGVISGGASPFRFEIDEQPEVLWLDREEEVFGRFFNIDRWPKVNTFNHGLDLIVDGDLDGGMEVMESALSAQVVSFPPGWEEYFPIVDAEDEGQRVDARIHLALAALHLDAGRLTEAETELRKTVDLVKGSDRWSFAADLLVVESRLKLLSGDATTAYRNLKRGVLGNRGIKNRETWTLLAIAAHQVGDAEVFAQARDRADELGVDLGPMGQH